MAATIAQWFTMIERSLVSLAEAMPEDRYGFRPTAGAFDGARTFGDQIKHVAAGTSRSSTRSRRRRRRNGAIPAGRARRVTKTELVRTSGVIRLCQRCPEDDDGNALDPAGGPYGGQSTRLGLATLAVWHASDHYGQLVIYLRMNGIVPPASRPAP